MLSRVLKISLVIGLTLISIICIWYSYKHIQTEKLEQETFAKLYDESVKKYDSLKGIKIGGLTLILNNTNVSDTIMVYLFSASDCGPCVDRGFDFIKMLNKEFKNLPQLYAISDNSAISGIQDRNDYIDYVYTDNDGIIRQELKFCLTPVLFLLDGNQIIGTYFPKDQFDINGRDNFKKWLPK